MTANPFHTIRGSRHVGGVAVDGCGSLVGRGSRHWLREVTSTDDSRRFALSQLSTVEGSLALSAVEGSLVLIAVPEGRLTALVQCSQR